MSVLRSDNQSPEVVATRTVELFARWVSIVLPALLDSTTEEQTVSPICTPIKGRLTDPTAVGYVGRAVHLLREQMAEPWTVTELAKTVALSRAHLTRLFVIHAGIAPMRFLTEVRLTEFTRLLEETDLSVTRAASEVGWDDPRVASEWFRRRYGITPSQYRLTPHPYSPSSNVAAERLG